ncbi:MAG: hypothetical protein BWK80_49735, partial [Desulfobacteraceae bacterium IS3]
GEWVAWTPEGYYDSSVNGDKYIGWHINQGEDRSALYYPASQFADRFRKPLVVANYLKTNGNLDEAIRLANAEDPKKQKTEETSISQINKLLPPAVFFEQPSESDTESSEQIFCVKAGAKSLTDEPVKDIWLILNGKQDRGIQRIKKDKTAEPRKQLQGKEAIVEQCFELNPGENRISVSASAGQTSAEPETIRVIWKEKKSSDEDIYKPNLYLLSIGVSKYVNKYVPNLLVADKDAEAIADVFKAQQGKLYRNVNVKLLLNENATGDNILDGLDWILKESTQKDMSVIFISGHGENDEAKNYYFLPYEADFERLRRTGVAWLDFKDVVKKLPSKTLFMVDTCASGNITGTRRRGATDMTEALRELMQSSRGTVVMAGSTGVEVSVEKSEWGHGAFTKALVEGLGNFQADYNKNNSIEIKELDLYVTERVKELTKGSQHPTTEVPKTMPNFPIAVR